MTIIYVCIVVLDYSDEYSEKYCIGLGKGQ